MKRYPAKINQYIFQITKTNYFQLREYYQSQDTQNLTLL